MLCQNCGKNEANVRYTQIINGVKKEMALCQSCSKELGIGHIEFNMPINLSSFWGEFLEDSELLPSFIKPKEIICDKCRMTYEEFTKIGKFGCENCYSSFSDKIDSILKNIQGGNRHIGRIAISRENNKMLQTKEIKEEKVEQSKLEVLKNDLKIAIREERYEDAAKIRDEIKKLENK